MKADQPNPTPSSEWTVAEVLDTGCIEAKGKRLHCAECAFLIAQKHNEQLAAERERAETIRRDWQQAEQELMRSNQQLAAAVELLGCSRYDAGDDESMNKEEALRNWIRAEDNPGFHRHE